MEPAQLFEFVQILALAAGLALVLAAAVIDVRKFRIPNWLNLSFLAVAVLFALVTPEFKWVPNLAWGIGMFCLGAILFQFRMLGGGDVKLLAVVAFLAGTPHMMGFAFITALAGGVVGVIYLSRSWLHKRRLQAADPATDYDIMQQPIPFGVAIAAGGVYVFLSIVEHLELVVGM